MPGNGCEWGAQGEAVAVQTVGARGVREMREQGRPLGAKGAVQGEEAGGAPRGPVQTGLPAVGRPLGLQRREERVLRQRGQAPPSVQPQGGEAPAGQRGPGRGRAGLAVEREGEGVQGAVRAGGDGERVKGRGRREREEALHAAGGRR